MAESTDIEAPASVADASADAPETIQSILQDLYDRPLEDLHARLSGLPDDSAVMMSYEDRMIAKDKARICLTMILRDAQAELLGMSPERQGTVAPGILDRLAGEVWDMVVVDTGSTDATPMLATEKGARVYGTNWDHDFAKARNYAIERARPGTRFFLHLDGDEFMQREHVARANARCAVAQDNQVWAVPLEIRNDDMPIEGALTMQNRLFPAMWKDGTPQVRFTGKIHEQIRPSLLELGVEEELANDVRIVHTGYANPDRTKLKCVRNLEILEAVEKEDDAREAAGGKRERPGYHYWWHKSKCIAAIGNNPRRAMKHVGDVAMNLECRKTDAWLSAAAFRWLGHLLMRSGDPAMALRVWNEGAKIFPKDPTFPAYIGELLAQMGEREEAMKALETAMEREFPVSALDIPVQRIRIRCAEILTQLLREKAYNTPGMSASQRKKILVDSNRWEGVAIAARSQQTTLRAA